MSSLPNNVIPITPSEEGLEPHIKAFQLEIGQRVLKARKQAGLSRRELSEVSSVSQRYLAQLETGSGNISIGVLFRLAQALGLPPVWFMDAGEQDFLSAQIAELTPAARERVQQLVFELTEAPGKDKRVCLLGLRGAGKSTLGKLVAEDLGLPFVELNKIIEASSGMPIAELIALYGQEGYRKLERDAVNSVISERESCLLAVGGGVVSEEETFSRLLKNFHTVWLKASPQEHMQRVLDQGDHRPMAGNPRAIEDLKSLLTEREAHYAQADVQLDTSGRKLEVSRKDLKGLVSKFL